MWSMPVVRKLMRGLKDKAMFVKFEYCAFSAPWRKPTAFFTNAPFLFEAGRECDVAVRPHIHEALVGEDVWYEHGEPVGCCWRTAKAA